MVPSNAEGILLSSSVAAIKYTPDVVKVLSLTSQAASVGAYSAIEQLTQSLAGVTAEWAVTGSGIAQPLYRAVFFCCSMCFVCTAV